MSYQSGWKAINLEFTDRVPRTEYSVETYHWPLVQKVTGIDTSIEANREKAKIEFVKKWDYAFKWMAPSGVRDMRNSGGRITKMGHATYNIDGMDFDKDISCPFKTIEEVCDFDPYKEYGEKNQEELVKELNRRYHEQEDYWKGVTLTMGGVSGIFTSLIEIFGWEMLLMAIGKDSKKFDKVIEGYYQWIKQYFDAWAKTNCKAFMVHDDICWTSGPVAHPDWYRKYIFPRNKKLWEPILSAGKKLIFTSDGKYDMFFDDIVKCGAEIFVMEPGNDMKKFAEKYGKTHGFVGNADCRILLSGTKEEIYKEVKRCMEIGKKYPGFIMAVGNHIPPNTPIDNALYYNDLYFELSKR